MTGAAAVGDGVTSKLGDANGSREGDGDGESRMKVGLALGDGLGEAVGWTNISSEDRGAPPSKSKNEPLPGSCGLDM